jgi:hypothetical protein
VALGKPADEPADPLRPGAERVEPRDAAGAEREQGGDVNRSRVKNGRQERQGNPLPCHRVQVDDRLPEQEDGPQSQLQPGGETSEWRR